MIRRLLAGVHANASIIIALCSIFVASLSLHFTIRAQQADLAYKEISIQPRAWLGGIDDDMSLSLKNTGLGPAIIEGIDLVQNNRCISTDNTRPEDWQPKFQEFFSQAATTLYANTLPPMPWKKGGSPGLFFDVNLLSVGDSVRAGDTLFIIRLERGSLAEFQQLRGPESAKAKLAFSQAAFEVPIRIRMCSATGRTCGVIGLADACGPPEFGKQSLGG